MPMASTRSPQSGSAGKSACWISLDIAISWSSRVRSIWLRKYLAFVIAEATWPPIVSNSPSWLSVKALGLLLTFAVLVFMIIAGFVESLFTDGSYQAVVGYLNLMQHMDDFGKGILDTRRLVYYLSATVLMLFLAARALESRKWR